MLQLDYTNPQPIYEQIREKIKDLIFRELLPPHHQLPSVREMAAALAVNPNTIQKAYRDLEAGGYLYSVRGKGSYVAVPTILHLAQEREKLLMELAEPVKKLRYLNLPLDTIIEKVRAAYETASAGAITDTGKETAAKTELEAKAATEGEGERA